MPSLTDTPTRSCFLAVVTYIVTEEGDLACDGLVSFFVEIGARIVKLAGGFGLGSMAKACLRMKAEMIRVSLTSSERKTTSNSASTVRQFARRRPVAAESRTCAGTWVSFCRHQQNGRIRRTERSPKPMSLELGFRGAARSRAVIASSSSSLVLKIALELDDRKAVRISPLTLDHRYLIP